MSLPKTTDMPSSSFSDKLLVWYQKHQRDLPWRQTTDPYLIWLSEIILQQTRVQQGLPYYLRFAEAYPTVQALAQAPEDEVLRHWQGLGYYSRARNLMAAAKQVVHEFNGVFPATYRQLIRLKGVGSYTAAAIASFAFKEPVAVVDGNVFRVLARIFGVEEDISSPKGKKTFEQLANELISQEHPDLHNQAIMEFGALQCTPQKPDCLFCPFVQECQARKTGRQGELPLKLKKTKVRNRYFHYVIMQAHERVFLKNRQEKDIWQGLYDFYLIERDNLTEWKELKNDGLISELTQHHKIVVEKSVETYQHILSHQRIFACFYRLTVFQNFEDFSARLQKRGLKGFTLTQVSDLPKPVLILKYLTNESDFLEIPLS